MQRGAGAGLHPRAPEMARLMAEPIRKTVSILFNDVGGRPTAARGARDDPAGAAVAEREALRGRVEKYRGEWIGEVAGGALSTFDTAASAVSCGLEMQRARAGDGATGPRIGIHIGELEFRHVPTGTEVFGDPILVAARLPGLAEPGGICISGRVYQSLARDRMGLEFEYLGERTLKSVRRPVPVYRVVDPARAPSGAPGLEGNRVIPRRLPWLILLASTALAAALGLVAAFWVSRSTPSPSVDDREVDGIGRALPAEPQPESPGLLAFTAVRDELLALGPTGLGARVRTIPDPVRNNALYHVEFEADCDCTVLLFSINGTTAEIALLYPNLFEPRARIARGATLRIPSSPEWRLRAVGREAVDVLKLIAVDDALDFPGDLSEPWVVTPDQPDRVAELWALLGRIQLGAWGAATAPLQIVP